MADNQSTDEPRPKKVMKNFLLVSLSNVCVYTSFNAVTNLQSSINMDQNIGLYSLAIISGCSIFSALFITSVINFLVGYKWALFISHIGFLTYALSNIYPKAWLVYPASVLCGICRAVGGSSWSSYIASLSESKRNNGSSNKAVKYFALSFLLLQTNQIWGNLITFLVLRNGLKRSAQNNTDSCGASFLESDHSSSANDQNKVSMTTTAVLFGIFGGIVLVAFILVGLFLDPRDNSKQSDSKGICHDSLKHSADTLKQLKNPKHLCFIFIPFSVGAFEAFSSGIFTKSFITCSVGIEYVGLIMMVFGVAACAFSIVVAYSDKYHYQSFIFYVACLISYGVFLTMLFWKPSSSQIYVLYILAVLQGIADAVWDPLISAICEQLFADQKVVAYSIMISSMNAGYLVVYLYAASLRTRTAIILQIIYLTMAVIGYTILKMTEHCKRSTEIPAIRLSSITHIDAE